MESNQQIAFSGGVAIHILSVSTPSPTLGLKLWGAKKVGASSQ